MRLMCYYAWRLTLQVACHRCNDTHSLEASGKWELLGGFRA
jgi:hypothetical protein